jgi:hypothetical protein
VPFKIGSSPAAALHPAQVLQMALREDRARARAAESTQEESK